MTLFRRRRREEVPATILDLASAEQRSATAKLTARCPKCRGESALDQIDLVDGVVQLRCIACGHTWEEDEAELSGSA